MPISLALTKVHRLTLHSVTGFYVYKASGLKP